VSSTHISEYQIMEALRQTPTDRWGEVLAFVTDLRAPVAKENPPTQWTAAELLKLPLRLPVQRPTTPAIPN
jgi:hypothetical protein